MAHYRPGPQGGDKRGAKASVGRYAASDPAGDRKPPDRVIGFIGLLTQRRRRLPRRQQVRQEHRHRLRDITIRPGDTVGLTVIARGHEPPGPRHDEPGKIPSPFFSRFDHADKLAT